MSAPTRSLGAVVVPGGVRFRVWAPGSRAVEVVFPDRGTSVPLEPEPGGDFSAFVPGVRPGDRYLYRLDGSRPYPDPASRFQPEGVHGPSVVVDPSHPWTDHGWEGLEPEALVFYELHVGTFTPAGTFDGVRETLGYLKELGVTAVQLMPVADFPGRWNWGYDGAALFAPSRAYGSPESLRELVNTAHRLGLAVFLDVVYNHLGPDGCYLPAFAPCVFNRTRRTPWGWAINFDGEGSHGVRRFFIENALAWLEEYHLDGLRLDATHAIHDRSSRHFLRELREAADALPPPRRYLVAEDHRNLNLLVLPLERGGYGLDAVWSDDFHHQMRRLLAGDDDGYFADFTDSTADLARILQRGWLYCGEFSRYFGGPRGTDPTGIPLFRFVHFLQNHDQVGNRPQGDRLTASVPLHVYRAASALLLLGPGTPLLFMGQEWAARTPFLYFTDHEPELGRKVSDGRRREFQAFRGFSGDVPDPQDPQTFYRSRLDWGEVDREPHVSVLRLYRDALRMRRGLAPFTRATSPVEGGLVVERGPFTLVVALRDGISLPAPAAPVRWTTEDPAYAPDPTPPVSKDGRLWFPRAAAAAAWP